MANLAEQLRETAKKAKEQQEINEENRHAYLKAEALKLLQRKLKWLDKKFSKFYKKLPRLAEAAAKNGYLSCKLAIRWDQLPQSKIYNIHSSLSDVKTNHIKSLPGYVKIEEFCQANGLRFRNYNPTDYMTYFMVDFSELPATRETKGEEPMFEIMDKQLQEAFDQLSEETNCDTGAYIGQGRLKVMSKSLDRIRPKIEERAKRVDPLFIIKNVSEADDNGMCIVEIGYEKK